MLFIGSIAIRKDNESLGNNFESNFIKYQDKVVLIINNYFLQIKANYKIHWGDYVEMPDPTLIDNAITYNYTRLSVYQNIPMLYRKTGNSTNEFLERIIKLINNNDFGEPIWLNSQVLSTSGIQPISITDSRHATNSQYPTFRTIGKNFTLIRITNRNKGHPRLFVNEQMYESKQKIKAKEDVSNKVSSISKSDEDIFHYLSKKNIREVSVFISSQLNYKNYKAEKYDLYAPLKLNSFMERNDNRVLLYYHTIYKKVVNKIVEKTELRVFKLAIPSSSEMDKMVALAYYLSFADLANSGNITLLNETFFGFNFVDPKYPAELSWSWPGSDPKQVKEQDETQQRAQTQSVKTDIEKYANQWEPLHKPIYFDFFSVCIYFNMKNKVIVYNYPIIKFFRDTVELFVVVKNNRYYDRLRNVLQNQFHLIDFILNLFKNKAINLIKSTRTSTNYIGYAVVR